VCLAEEDLTTAYLVASAWDLRDAVSLAKFREDVALVDGVFRSGGSMWDLLANAFQYTTRLSEPPTFVRKMCADNDEWTTFTRAFEPMHYSARTVTPRKLLPVGPTINAEHPIRHDCMPGLYSCKLTLLLSNPMWRPERAEQGGAVFSMERHGAVEDEGDKCEALLLVSNMRFIHALPPQLDGPEMWDRFQRACSRAVEIIRDGLANPAFPTFRCPGT